MWYPDVAQVGLIYAGDGRPEQDRRGPLARLRETLLHAAADYAYGYVKRGSSPWMARNG